MSDSRSSSPSAHHDAAIESTPLLAEDRTGPRYDGASRVTAQGDNVSISSRQSSQLTAQSLKQKSSWRWPSIIASLVLATASLAIIALVFIVPSSVEEYAKEAAVLEPTNLSLESLTADGARARIQATFRLDGSRVKNEHVRRVGRAATWVARELGTERTAINVYLPQYDDILLGTASVPPLVINLRDGQTTTVDFVADLVPGDPEGVRTIANEWLEGRLDVLRVRGSADIQLKSGMIPLGTHEVSESFTFEANELPEIPAYNITKLNFHEVGSPDHERQGMAVKASLSAFNPYPVSVDIPSLGFEILFPDCDAYGPYILVANASTSDVDVRPRSEVNVRVDGLIRELPESLIHACPDSTSSPLDIFLKQYMNGDGATLFVRGKKEPTSGTPPWLAEILSSVTVPVEFPGRTFGSLIRNFTMANVHFSLPDPLAEPGDPDADPKVSGTILVTAALPKEMNLELNVSAVRATADVSFKGNKFGELNLTKWQAANSTRLDDTTEKQPMLQIQSDIHDAPINITDADIFSDVIQSLLFGGKDVKLSIDALVAVKVQTVLGEIRLKDVPAQGQVPIKPLPVGSIGDFQPKIGRIRILDTTSTTINLEALVNITNPTPYTAFIPAANVHLLHNGTKIGEASAQQLTITRGQNTNLLVGARWDSLAAGDHGRQIGRDLISAYLSGFNTTLTVRGHSGSIPGQPLIGEALSRVNLTFDAPRIRLPDDPDGEQGHFIQSALFHVISSTASFILVSPLEDNYVYIERVNATAYYNHTEPVGRIIHDLPFAAAPGVSTTPRMPVEWSLGSVGFEKLKAALGGTLKLDTKATVSVRLGRWRETLWYVGRGIAAHVRP